MADKPERDTDGNGQAATGAELKAFLQEHRGERHIIVLQDFPDPDAISSALAHRLISDSLGIQTEIVHGGSISHQQNIALVKLLQIELTPFSASLELDRFDGAVFVDNQGTTAEEIVRALDAAGVPTLVVVDHHDPQEMLDPAFQDIRKTGAAATIYAAYLQEGLVELQSSNEEHVQVATALMHGIFSDTAMFVRAVPADFQAASYISRFMDPDILEKILNQTRSKKSMEIISKALSNKTIIESFSISGIGYLRAEDRDAIPQATDFLVTEENVHTAIVYGIVRGDNFEESLVGSLRTNKITLDPDEFIKDVFGRDAYGNYFGGGKVSAGGFQIPLGFLAGEGSQEYLDLKWQTFDTRIKQRIFDKIGVEGEESA